MRSQGVSVYFIEVDNDHQGFLSQQYQLAASTMPDYQGINGYEAVRVSLRLDNSHRKLIIVEELPHTAQHLNQFHLIIQLKRSGVCCDATILGITMSYTILKAICHLRLPIS